MFLDSFQIALPADAERKNTKVYEEVVIPPNTPLPPKEETAILISSLDEVSVRYYEMFKCLNEHITNTSPQSIAIGNRF